jgi:glycosyltransferase involved in cell wall biosynthesis
MNPPLLNLTLPVFNEERVLADSVGRVLGFLAEHRIQLHELVIANNGSTDGTAAIADALSRKHSVVRVIHLAQAGRGRALKQIWLASDADILSYMDVDLSTDLAAFPVLIGLLTDGGCDLAVGSRRLPKSQVRRSLRRELPSRLYHFLLRRLFHSRFTDAQCGFKAIRKEAAERLLPLVEDAGWFMDAELLILAERMGLRTGEMPVRWEEDTDSRVRVGRDSWATLRAAWRLRRRLNRRDMTTSDPTPAMTPKQGGIDYK